MELDEAERNKRLKNRVVQEIISSEKSYLEQLEMLVKCFVTPSRDLLPRKSFSSVFGDIEPLIRLNRALYEELMSDQSVGTTFRRIAPYLKIYSTYANDYKLALNVLQNLREKDKVFEAFVSQQERLPEVCRKLEALLIAPIQRVPRYRLLLAQLVSHTEQNDVEFPVLREALEQVELVAKHINEQIREHENMQRMISIQKCLAHGRPRIIVPGRSFIKEGTLKKVSSDCDSAHQRHFVLFSDMLIYCRIRSTDTNQAGSLLCVCVLPLRHCRAEAVVGDGLFKVTCRDESLLLCSENSGDGRHWIEAINRTAEQLEHNLRTLRKESSNRRPVRHGRYPTAPTCKRSQPEEASKRLHYTQNLVDKENEMAVPAGTERGTTGAETRSPKWVPKWPAPCPAPYSPSKLAKLTLHRSSPKRRIDPHPAAAEGDPPLFYSPLIQTDIDTWSQ